MPSRTATILWPTHEGFARDQEYQRHGTLSLLAGIDLLSGHVHARVEDRHRSREFIGFLKQLDIAYSPQTAIKLILDNHAAHVSKETKAGLPRSRRGVSPSCSPQNTAPGSISWRASFPKWRARCCVTFGSLPRPNSEAVSLPTSAISTEILSSTPGPTKLASPRDRSRSMETLY